MWLTALTIALLVTVILGGLGMSLVGLPGNWLMVSAALLQKLLAPEDSRVAMSWYLLGAILVVALLGEVLELVTSAWGVAKVGGSRRAVSAALGGSIVGGLLGLWIPIPIPFVGPMLGAVFFAGLGAFAGAYTGERTLGRKTRESLPVGAAAFVGRIAGTSAKFACGVVIAAMLLFSLLA